ncbi:MAG: hypothetical protein CMD81_13900 [Gammaproteobacteria bacterium]|nr:hypothetical protein [Gammaproteobacteria bacterium]MBK84913.1 hypothetical protein [Gammaproteobacteria bacterium]|tara:strand:+ start:404 stop:871 length:468 start_codon:yes stop_codon:yes gene_type:complete
MLIFIGLIGFFIVISQFLLCIITHVAFVFYIHDFEVTDDYYFPGIVFGFFSFSAIWVSYLLTQKLLLAKKRGGKVLSFVLYCAGCYIVYFCLLMGLSFIFLLLEREYQCCYFFKNSISLSLPYVQYFHFLVPSFYLVCFAHNKVLLLLCKHKAST